MADPLHTINGVEIFKAGTWNGDAYTVDDLDDMVDAFGKAGFVPPVKLGHDSTIGARAWGWVKKLRRVGDKLIADFIDVPQSLYDLIKERGYDAVSAEVYWNMSRNGHLLRRCLKAVALLGSEPPGVAGLAPLRTVVNEIAGPYRTYNFEWEYSAMTQPHADPGAALIALAQKYQIDHPGISDRAAFELISRSTPEGARLLAEYNANIKNQRTAFYANNAPSSKPKNEPLPGDVGTEVHNRACAYLEANPQVKSYQAAIRQVFAADHDLVKRYAMSTRPPGRVS